MGVGDKGGFSVCGFRECWFYFIGKDLMITIGLSAIFRYSFFGYPFLSGGFVLCWFPRYFVFGNLRPKISLDLFSDIREYSNHSSLWVDQKINRFDNFLSIRFCFKTTTSLFFLNFLIISIFDSVLDFEF